VHLHWQHNRRPVTTEEMCDDLERLTEGLVACHVADIEADPDAYPCCVKCGDLQCNPAPGFAAPSPSHGDDAEAAPDVDDGPGHVRAVGLVMKNAQQLVTSKEGNALELAAFQCAQEVRRGRDCRVGIAYDTDDRLRAFVVYADGTTKEPALQAVSRNPCACEVVVE
jgi:hypothetical protein